MRPWPSAAVAAWFILFLLGDAAAAPSTSVDPDDVPPDEKAGTDASPARVTPVEPPAAHGTVARNWFSVAFQADTLLLPSASNACAGGTGYTCFTGGAYDARAPLADADDVVAGGLMLATVRVLFGYDRAITRNVTVGARLGYAFRGGPQRPGGSAFEPLHLEARASYWFGDDPLGRAGLRFYGTGALGVAEVDANVVVDVYASAAAYRAGQSQNDQAWKKTGLGFGALGIGAMIALTPNSGVMIELRGEEWFPTSGTGASLQLGYAIGL